MDLPDPFVCGMCFSNGFDSDFGSGRVQCVGVLEHHCATVIDQRDVRVRVVICGTLNPVPCGRVKCVSGDLHHYLAIVYDQGAKQTVAQEACLDASAMIVKHVSRHWDELVEFSTEGINLFAVSEHLVAAHSAEAFDKKVKEHGWSSHLATAPLNAQGKPMGGVGILATQGLELVPTHFDALSSAEESGRVATAWVLLQGKPILHVLAVYSHVNPLIDNTQPAEDLWTGIAAWVHFHGGQPLCVIGDCNAELGEFPPIDVIRGSMLPTLDLYTETRPMTHSAVRAIDHCFHSENLASSILGAYTDKPWRFPNHKAIVVQLDAKALTGKSGPNTGVSLEHRETASGGQEDCKSHEDYQLGLP
eukprot:3399050-Amphidinium_carterae.1